MGKGSDSLKDFKGQTEEEQKLTKQLMDEYGLSDGGDILDRLVVFQVRLLRTMEGIAETAEKTVKNSFKQGADLVAGRISEKTIKHLGETIDTSTIAATVKDLNAACGKVRSTWLRTLVWTSASVVVVSLALNVLSCESIKRWPSHQTRAELDALGKEKTDLTKELASLKKQNELAAKELESERLKKRFGVLLEEDKERGVKLIVLPSGADYTILESEKYSGRTEVSWSPIGTSTRPKEEMLVPGGGPPAS